MKTRLILITAFALGCLFLAGQDLSAQTTNQQVSLNQVHNYPNPFHNKKEVTTIKFFAAAGKAYANAGVSILIYDYNGKKVWTKRVLINIPAGSTAFEVPWGGENDLGKKVAPGLYYGKVILEAANTKTRTLKILVK